MHRDTGYNYEKYVKHRHYRKRYDFETGVLPAIIGAYFFIKVLIFVKYVLLIFVCLFILYYLVKTILERKSESSKTKTDKVKGI